MSSKALSFMKRDIVIGEILDCVQEPMLCTIIKCLKVI